MIKLLNLGTIMAKEKLIRDTRALTIGFCSGVPTGLLLILALNMSWDSGGRPSDVLLSVNNNNGRYIDYDPTEELLLLREMVTNLSSQTSGASVQVAPAPIEREIVLREWQSPAVVNIREGEDRGETIFGEVPRRLTPLGTGGFLFIQFGAYRSSSRSFGVVGLGMRSMQTSWRSPQFECAWRSASGAVVPGNATKYLLPDSSFTSQYVAVVVHCTFDRDVGSDGMGGLLRMIANHGDMDGTGLEDVWFVAMTEKPGEYDASVFNAPYKYEYLYCGSPLFSDNGTFLNPQRVREWIGYHMKFFGSNSHFILYDAGGINEEVLKFLDPWLKLGRITIMNFRQQARYDTSVHAQFLVLNDCMYRAKSLAKWTFFFDIDEYVHFERSHIPVVSRRGEARPQQPNFQSFQDLMSYLEKLGRKATSVTFQQRPMDDTHCVETSIDAGKLERLWMIEKLVFRRFVETRHYLEWTHWMDHKYAIQAKYVLAVGVHDVAYVVEAPGTPYTDTWMWETFENCENCLDGDVLHYYHYHNTITFHDDLCREPVELGIQYINVTGHHKFDNGSCWLDQTMAHDGIVDSVKAFELQMIGP